MIRFLSLALLVLGLSVAAFLLGRFSAAPTFETVASGRDDPLAAAFEDFLRAQQEAIAVYRQSAFFEDDQERAEAYRGLLYALVGSIKTGALQSAEHPRFMRAVDWTSKAGLDNPDNNYYVAVIDDDADYRITGRRGTTANLVFQLLLGQPGVRDAGTSTNVSLLYERELLLDAEANFEIIVSRQDPGEGVNWLQNAEGAQTLLVRYTHSDWSAERDGPLHIEKIGAEGAPALQLTPARMALGLREAAVSLFDRTATWLQFAERAWLLTPRNTVSAPRLTRGGLVGQYSAFGSWELDNSQAIVLSVARTNADYQGIALGNLWFVSLDYETRTSSLNLSQMHCSDDERCHAVISHRDPGIQNWLDTEGHRRGLIILRWQGLDEALEESQYPSARLVPFDSVADYLPEHVPAFSEAQRRQQIRQRRAAVHARFGG